MTEHYLDEDNELLPDKLWRWLVFIVSIPIGVLLLFIFGERKEGISED